MTIIFITISSSPSSSSLSSSCSPFKRTPIINHTTSATPNHTAPHHISYTTPATPHHTSHTTPTTPHQPHYATPHTTPKEYKFILKNNPNIRNDKRNFKKNAINRRHKDYKDSSELHLNKALN
ncbi:hypothetical protein HELRODRAFT_166680 [Helobdella robusta]|uniref:Uncharacterized protein n=1 Tax=Helobdella robusta TaxID=6412 RepID=T1EYC8_HELRO|nr:hypothetical protein HELRODRAFT_166680 [Helobdella robusta]ESO11666.1 hypothetical protein HELRODRAFT_166680 [Helobdella robusta]